MPGKRFIHEINQTFTTIVSNDASNNFERKAFVAEWIDKSEGRSQMLSCPFELIKNLSHLVRKLPIPYVIFHPTWQRPFRYQLI